MTLPKILVIDDEYPQEKQVRAKNKFLIATHLLEIDFTKTETAINNLLNNSTFDRTPGKKQTSTEDGIIELSANSSDKIGFAVFCPGQKRENGQLVNDADVALEAVKKGIDKWGGWALILLDLNFESDIDNQDNKTFGLKIRKRLLEEYPDLKIVMLTTEHQTNLKDSDIEFLPKRDLNNNDFFLKDFVPKLTNYAGLDSTQFVRFLDLKDKIACDRNTIECFRQAYVCAQDTSSILLLGETGVGKEVFAKYIHRMSTRKDKPFVACNLSDLSSSIIESELFGHEKGAFTGAIARKEGKFKDADGGVIFLDEIGDLDVDIQIKLLRVLQEKEFTRVGGKENIKVDVRVISATNQNLQQLIQEKRFREDLYYRLNHFNIIIPALRDRKDDIMSLAESMLKNDRKFAPDACPYLISLQFPGNVRQLENLMGRLNLFKPSNSMISKDDIENHYKNTGLDLKNQSKGASPLSFPPTANIGQGSALGTIEAQSDDPVIKAIDDIKKVLSGKSDDLTGVLRKIEEVVGAILNRAKKSNQFMPAKNLMELLLDTNIIQKGVPGSEKKSKKGKKEKKEKTSKQYKHSISVSNPSVETQKIFGHIQAFCSHETLDSALEDYFGSRRQKKDETTSNST